MPRRAMWKGIITFGPVRVPVKLYAAIREVRVDLDLLHATDLVPVRQEMVCTVEGVPVPPEHRLKGVKLDADYVVIAPDTLAALEPPPSRDIEVVVFAPAADLDPRYLERAYYLGPDTDPDRYATLRHALAETNLTGICQWVMRRRAYLGALDVWEGMLVLTTLRFADEVVPETVLEIPAATIAERERTVARYLIDELSGDFVPEAYAPEQWTQLEALIAAKARGEMVAVPPPIEVSPTPEDDLLAMLEASLRKAKTRHAA